MKFNLNDYKDYKGKYAMHCKTKEEAESFCRFLDLSGRSWFSGGSYLEVDYWDRHKIDTVYYFNRGTYGSVEHIRRDVVILEWSDFMENKETVSEFTQDITGVLGQLLDEVELPDELHEQVYDLYKRAAKLL